MAYFVLKLVNHTRTRRSIECYHRSDEIHKGEQFLWSADIFGDDETPVHVQVDGGTTVLPDEDAGKLLVRID